MASHDMSFSLNLTTANPLPCTVKRDLDFSTETYCTSCHTHKRQRVETPSSTLGMDLLTIDPMPMQADPMCDVLVSDDHAYATHTDTDLEAEDFGDLLDFDPCEMEEDVRVGFGSMDCREEKLAATAAATSVGVEVKEESGRAAAKKCKSSGVKSTELTAAAKRKKFPGQNTQWSALEETFLVGAVMDWFFRHGSLTPARKGGGGKMSVWDFIKKTFDDWMHRYAVRSGKPKPQGRSAKALNRHYKSMKTHKNPGFYQLYKKFSAYESILRMR